MDVAIERENMAALNLISSTVRRLAEARTWVAASLAGWQAETRESLCLMNALVTDSASPGRFYSVSASWPSMWK